MHTFIKKTLTISLAVLLAFGANMLLAAGTWSAAPSSPPNNNVDAPLNVGSVTQEKSGLLKAGGLWSTAGDYFSTVLGVAMIDANFHSLAALINGKIGATAYCDIAGAKCVTPGDLYNLSQSTSTAATTTSSAVLPADYSGKVLVSDSITASGRYIVAGPKTFTTTKTGVFSAGGYLYGANNGAGGLLRSSIVIDGFTCGWGELYRPGSSRDFQVSLACVHEIGPGTHTVVMGESHEGDFTYYDSYVGYYVVEK